MKIRINSMFGENHSWAITMRSLALEFIKLGHEIFISSIDSYSFVEDELMNYSKREIHNPDLDICYTAPQNFNSRWAENSKKRMAIYNYETIPLPVEWKDSHQHVDYVLPSSSFSKEVFLQAGWPEKKLKVIPHGISHKLFFSSEKFSLGNQKKFRFLNVSIPHARKNIPLLYKAYLEEFSSLEDVCLVLKTNLKTHAFQKRKRFEIDLLKELKQIQVDVMRQGKDKLSLPCVELIDLQMEDVYPLFRACDALVSASSSEGFGLPLLEALALGKRVIAPNCTGHLDFLNVKNSLLVNVEKIPATPQYQYWHLSKDAWTYRPLIKDLKKKMRYAFKHGNYQMNEVERLAFVEKFSWENAAKKILELV